MSFGLATVRFAPPGEPGVPRPGGVPAVVVGDRVIALDALVGEPGDRPPPRSVREVLADGDDWWSGIEDADAAAGGRAGWTSTDDVVFLPSLPDPPTIYCAGANYHDHIEEMTGKPPDAGYAIPYHFLAPAGALAGHREEVTRPPGCSQLDWEVELAVVIGRRAEHVKLDDALEHVAGYTIANDLSLRDFAMRPDVPFGVDWIRSKCYAGCLPMGPTIVPRRFVPDPQQLKLTLSVNGDVMQDSTTALMLFSVAQQIVALSRIVALTPGDIICTGTPAGVGFARNQFLEPGDVTVAEIEGLGRLENRVVAPAAPADAAGDAPVDARGS